MSGLRLRHASRLRVTPSSETRPLITLDQIGSGGTGLLGELQDAGPDGQVCFEPGDVLFSKLRPYLSKSLLVTEAAHGTGELLALVPGPVLDPRFLFYVTLSKTWLDRAIDTSYGTKMPRTSWEAMCDFVLPDLSLDEQRRIAGFLDDQVGRIDEVLRGTQAQLDLVREVPRASFASLLATLVNSEKLRQSPRLGWLTTVMRGASPRPIDDPKYFDADGSHGWVRISDVTAAGKYLNTTTQALSDLGRSLSVEVEPGELILSISASVGVPCIVNVPCCIHDGFVVLRDPSVDVDFLYMVLKYGDTFAGIGNLGTQINLNSDIVRSARIPDLEPVDQAHVVSAMQEVEASTQEAVSLLEERAALLGQYRESLISLAIRGDLDVTTHESGISA